MPGVQREIVRHGLCEAGEVVAISDAAFRIRGVCGVLLAGRMVTFIPGPQHAVECAGAALRVPCPGKAERKEQMEAVRRELKAGKVDAVTAALAPYRHEDEAMAKCVGCFAANKAQMQRDKYRQRGMQIGFGVVKSADRQIPGLRMKRPESHSIVTRANAAPAIKRCQMNCRQADFLDRKARQAVSA